MTEQSSQNRSYTKIPPYTKKSLILKVFQNGLKIKQAAQQLQLKYATAKTIILNYRKKVVRKKLIFKSKKPCLILPLDNLKNKRNINIVSLVGGKLQKSE
ncbi:unnamed protein product (macronuclear) [Paramecium tetraurelia]|uniref:HTH psq-type domain-containing protein n=1 Tax=Paramecium tetraurelia TaxID=5888 RepID=A0DER7_PARTE|nr:uncharacterized protein GSPATT00016360001 [Paramecium tetraurelia]CAK81534.1 unnamed protein product [Paramecium tetraurelia]|eukprot:XP_001448931.1 hypothetical protein (macronuclear) [Paramecium tetraurelia strain d4-2]